MIADKSKKKAYISMICLGVAFVLALIGTGSTLLAVVGGLVALFGLIPALFVAWDGVQLEKQSTLAVGIGLAMLSLLVGAGSLVLTIVRLIR